MCTGLTVTCRRSSCPPSTTTVWTVTAAPSPTGFWLETLTLVREAVGDRCAVAVRIGIDPDGPAGVAPDEALEFVRLADDLVDLWDVNTSVIARPWLDMRPARIGPAGYELNWTGRVKSVTNKPVVLVERLTEPDRMAELVRSGVCDLIGGARPSISDPFLPRKVEEGRAADIRECIGCNVCVARVGVVDHIACTQNATAGEEYRRGWHPERFERARNADRGVLVVGGRPVGGLRSSGRGWWPGRAGVRARARPPGREPGPSGGSQH